MQFFGDEESEHESNKSEKITIPTRNMQKGSQTKSEKEKMRRKNIKNEKICFQRQVGRVHSASSKWEGIEATCDNDENKSSSQ